MSTFLMISKHSPENCAMFNEKARKMALELMEKLEGLLKKHGVKMVGPWFMPTEHLGFMVFEAPSLEAFQKLVMEPEFAARSAYNTTEIKLAYTLEDSAAMMPQTK